MPGHIFLSYRRDDAAAAAGRLFDRLERTFGRDQLFIDVDSIEPGLDFVEAINDTVAKCEVLIAVIGPDWTSISDENGRRRLDNPNDYVRIEVAAALERKIRVIPVLVEGATMPDQESLPEDLAPLARRNAFRLSHERFAAEASDLTELLARLVPVDGQASANEPRVTARRGRGADQKVAAEECDEQEARRLAILEVLEDYKGVDDIYIQPEVPSRKETNFRTSAGVPLSVDILCLIDCTVFGSGKDGVAICEDAIYHRNAWVTGLPISYDLLKATAPTRSGSTVQIGGTEINFAGYTNTTLALRLLNDVRRALR